MRFFVPYYLYNVYLCGRGAVMRAKYTKSDRAMQLFYDPDFVPPLHTLGEEESRHCVRVLRLAEGDSLHLTDGRGTLYRCRIVSADPRRCTVEAVETVHDFEPLPYRLVMGVAPTKNADRFEWFLEKATEVGVTAIVPLETDHSERRVFRPQRGEKVITAAIKQSLKAFRPELRPLAPLREVQIGRAHV